MYLYGVAKAIYRQSVVNPTVAMTSAASSVCYVHSPTYLATLAAFPKLPARPALVHELTASLGALQHCIVKSPLDATRDDLLIFHDEEYVHALEHAEDLDDIELTEAGLVDDCPVFPELWNYVLAIAGATLTAAQAIVDGHCRYAINWGGGWHHAHTDQAAGFCYVNDCVLAILRLRTRCARVLYLDIDLHHGDGVEEAFETSPYVMTISTHRHERGFFPGSGHVDDIGSRRGQYYTVNVPLKEGCSDAVLEKAFKGILDKAVTVFRPEAIVMQCGADGLLRDPNASFNLTTKGIGTCVQHTLDLNIPVVFLGGGGYHEVDTARCWAYLTALIVCHAKSLEPGTVQLDGLIQDHEYWEQYGSDFQLHTRAGNQVDHNTEEYISGVLRSIDQQLGQI